MHGIVLCLTIYSTFYIANTQSSLLWTRKIIPFLIQGNIWNKTLIEDVIQAFNKLTCVKWRKKSVEDHSYVIFKPDSACHSEVGKQKGAQYVSIGSHCNKEAVILHEMMHVMGFRHEMQRFDRDNHVEVLWENIKPGYDRYFEKMPMEDNHWLHVSYDVQSIMHYGPYDYSINPPTKVTLKVLDNELPMEAPKHLSAKDIQKVKELYDCKEDESVEGWSSWSVYSVCNKKCLKTKTRFCYSKSGDHICSNDVTSNPGIDVQETQCSVEECSTNGVWSRWSSWSECDVSCGKSSVERYRTCDSPPPRLHGASCHGVKQQSSPCRRGTCDKERHDCEFENDGYCFWKLRGGWKRTKSGGVLGPKNDVSFISGYYLLLQMEGSATLNIPGLTYKCVQMQYFTANASDLVVSFKSKNETFDYALMTDSNFTWMQANIPLGFHDDLRLEIAGKVNREGFVAIDDVFFKRNNCNMKNAKLKEPVHSTSHPTTSNMSTTSLTKITNNHSTKYATTKLANSFLNGNVQFSNTSCCIRLFTLFQISPLILCLYLLNFF